MNFRKYKVLIADQDLDNLALISFRLKELGFECLDFTKGLLLLIAAQSNRADLIILDYLLADLNYLSIINTLKSDSRTKDIPIILFVPKSSPLGSSPLLNLGIEMIVKKPFNFQNLERIIYQILHLPMPEF